MCAALTTGPSTAVSRWSSFLSAVKCTPNDKMYFLSNSRRLAAPRTWLHVLKPKRLPPPPPPPLIFTFKNFLQFVPNMSTQHPRTWSPTSSSSCEDFGCAENELSAAEQIKPDCCHTPAVVSILLTPLPVSCPSTTPLRYIIIIIYFIPHLNNNVSLSSYRCTNQQPVKTHQYTWIWICRIQGSVGLQGPVLVS